MNQSLVVFGTCLMIAGCAEPQPEPKSPKPVPVVIPEASPSNPAVPTDPERTSLVGKWSHTIPWIDGKERTVILDYIKDQDNRERFEFVQQYWSYKPVFVDQIKNGDETTINFKMVLYSNETEETEHTLKYVLKEDNGRWVGKLFESWTEIPYDVVLTRSK
jgi:hypothetical protein